MSDISANDTAEKRYLLGKCSEDEKTLLEESFFADDSKFNAFELAEDDLIDAFVRNKLSDEERRAFTERFIKSDRLIERVNFARALAERTDSVVVAEQEPVSREPPFASPLSKRRIGWWEGFFTQPAWRTALAASVVLILFASGILVTRWRQISSESERLAAERALLTRQKEELEKLEIEHQARNEQITAEMQREKERLAEKLSALEEADRLRPPTNRPPAGFATVFLTPGSVRSGGDRSELKLLPATTTVQLFMDLERNDYSKYGVTIKDVDNDKVVFSKKGLEPRKTGSGHVLVLLVPANRLPASDYNVSVHGLTASGALESVEDYAFRVSKR